jgi:hypothetical protein
MVILAPDVQIRQTGTPRGRGVFAARDFRIDELVETSPVVILASHFESLPLALQRMVYAWPRADESPCAQAIALGYGSLYNGANPANLRYERDLGHARIHFFAARAITSGEELTINYSAGDGSPTTHHDGWFTDHGIAPSFDPAR